MDQVGAAAVIALIHDGKMEQAAETLLDQRADTIDIVLQLGEVFDSNTLRMLRYAVKGATKATEIRSLAAEQPVSQTYVISHDDGSIYQFGENVFIAWDETGAGIAHADTDLESCRRGLRDYVEAING